MSTPPHDIHLLLRRLAEGDEEAFTAVFRQFKDGVYETALHFTQSTTFSEEIVQDVFLKVWVVRSTLMTVNDFPAWIYQVAKNRSLDVLRVMARKRRNELVSNIGSEWDYFPGIGEPRQGNPAETRDLQRLIDEALSKLTATQRKAFELMRVQGMSREEVGQIMGISPNTVKVHVLAATRSIRAHLITNEIILPSILAAFPVFMFGEG